MPILYPAADVRNPTSAVRDSKIEWLRCADGYLFGNSRSLRLTTGSIRCVMPAKTHSICNDCASDLQSTLKRAAAKQVWQPSLTSLAMPVKVTEITKETDSGYLFGRSGVRLDASARSSEFKFASTVDSSDSLPTRRSPRLAVLDVGAGTRSQTNPRCCEIAGYAKPDLPHLADRAREPQV